VHFHGGDALTTKDVLATLADAVAVRGVEKVPP
jgi:hypothetical protein